MSAAANGRILKELQEVGKNDTSGVQAKVISEGNIRHLRGTIKGPEGTSYEGGIFEIDIVIPKQYPFEAPKMKFITKIWHPNISSQTGAICLVRHLSVVVVVMSVLWSLALLGWELASICLASSGNFLIIIVVLKDILKDNWSPALTIKTALLSLQALLCSAEPADPQDAEVAKMYMSNREEFERTAKFWTESYAKPSSKEDAVSRVCEMGFDRESALRALEKHAWDESAAVNDLLGGI